MSDLASPSTPGSKKIDPIEAKKIAERRAKAKAKATAMQKTKVETAKEFELEEGVKRYELKKWNAILFWTYGGGEGAETHCAICKSELHDICLDCQANSFTVENAQCKVR
jgi:hypothetical protein